MKFNFNLASLKEKTNGVVVVVVLVLIMLGILGVGIWYTVGSIEETQTKIQDAKASYETNVLLLQNLKKLQSNSKYYLAQKEKYDEVIAENGSYTVNGYYAKIDRLCTKHNLVIEEIEVGKMEPAENVNMAKTTLTVNGTESGVRNMVQELISQKEIARVDSLALTQADEGNVSATMTIVNFTK